MTKTMAPISHFSGITRKRLAEPSLFLEELLEVTENAWSLSPATPVTPVTPALPRR